MHNNIRECDTIGRSYKIKRARDKHTKITKLAINSLKALAINGTLLNNHDVVLNMSYSAKK